MDEELDIVKSLELTAQGSYDEGYAAGLAAADAAFKSARAEIERLQGAYQIAEKWFAAAVKRAETAEADRDRWKARAKKAELCEGCSDYRHIDTETCKPCDRYSARAALDTYLNGINDG